MNYQLMPAMVSMREIQRNYKKLFSVIKRTQEPLYLFSGSKAEMVVLDVHMYEQLIADLKESEETRLKMVIEKGEAEYRAGKTKTGKLSQLL